MGTEEWSTQQSGSGLTYHAPSLQIVSHKYSFILNLSDSDDSSIAASNYLFLVGGSILDETKCIGNHRSIVAVAHCLRKVI